VEHKEGRSEASRGGSVRKLTLILVAYAAFLFSPLPVSAQPRDLDCVDFPSQAAAQEELQRDPTDPYGLDPDRDGIACESGRLPSRDQFLTYIVVASLVALAGALGLWRWTTTSREKRKRDLEYRIRQLSSNLQTAAHAVSEIEQEVRARQRLVDQLKRDAERAEILSKLHKAEVEAIAQTLQTQLSATERRSFRSNFILGFGFYVAGVVTTIITNALIH
jgi:outer membrane murein-binding lipoprotein Lpp